MQRSFSIWISMAGIYGMKSCPADLVIRPMKLDGELTCLGFSGPAIQPSQGYIEKRVI